MDDIQPLLGATEETVRRRKTSEKNKHWSEQIPEYARVYLARKKKPDPVYIKVIEALVVISTILFAIYCYLYFENVHFHAIHAYAHLGYSEAQHQVGQRYLHGVGVSAHPEKAMEWFKKASDQGHPHASFNLAIGHLKGIKTPLKSGFVNSTQFVNSYASVRRNNFFWFSVGTFEECIAGADKYNFRSELKISQQ